MVKIEIPDEQKLLMENDNCYREAVKISVYMVNKFYSEDDEFHPCDSTYGVLSQINNMVAGIPAPQK